MRDAIFTVGAQVSAGIGSLIGLRILTEVLNPTQYGTMAILMTAISIISIAYTGPLSNSAGRFYASAVAEKKTAQYYNSITVLMIPLDLIVIIACATALFLYPEDLKMLESGDEIKILIALALYAVIEAKYTILDNIANAAQKRILVFVSKTLKIWGMYSIVYLLAKNYDLKLSDVLLSYAASTFLVVVFLFLNVVPKEVLNIKKYSKGYIRSLFAYAWPFATWGVTLWAYNASSRFAVQKFQNIEEVANIAILVQLGSLPINFCVSALTAYLLPLYFEKAAGQNFANGIFHVYTSVLKWASISAVCLAMGFILAQFSAELVFQLLVADTYRDLYFLWPYSLTSFGLLGVAQVFSMALRAESASTVLVIPKNISYTIGCVLVTVGAYQDGIWGVLLALNATGIIHLVWIIRIFVKRYHNHKLMNTII